MAPINVGTLTDVGFVLFVGLACWQSLFAPARSEESRRNKWKGELGQVESMLKTLISEAGNAGANLQDNLLARQRELETVLSRLEGAQGIGGKESLSAKASAAPNARKSSGVADDVPNESWLKPFQTPVGEPVRVPRAAAPAPALEAMAAQRTDRVSISSQAPTPRPAPARPTAGPTAFPPQLNSQIEMTQSPAARSQAGQESPVRDPMAYQVAKRLLAEGKEIHVVARKLELPLAEVRMLDKLLRQDSSAQMPAPQPSTASRSFDENELARSVSENLVRHAAPARPKAPVIERERALL